MSRPTGTGTGVTVTVGRAGRRRGRWFWPRRLAVVALVLTVTAGATVLAAGYLVGTHLSGNVKRISGAFDGVPADDRPVATVTAHSQTILAVGLDVRAPDQTTGLAGTDPGAARRGDRSDTIMLVRINTKTRSAAIVSIPRDCWVPIPGHGHMKINAAYSLGGPSLLIRTVEQLTGVRVDHFMVIDFAGFKSIVDYLGGVDVQVATGTTDLGGVRFQPGSNHLDGTRALAFVRQRYGLPGGDLDRIRRQQSFLRAVLTKVAATDAAGDPVRTYRLLDAITVAVTVDDTYTNAELRALALEAVRLRGGNVWFLVAPISKSGWEGDQSVLYLNQTSSAELWQAFQADAMDGYAAAHPGNLLGSVTP